MAGSPLARVRDGAGNDLGPLHGLYLDYVTIVETQSDGIQRYVTRSAGDAKNVMQSFLQFQSADCTGQSWFARRISPSFAYVLGNQQYAAVRDGGFGYEPSVQFASQLVVTEAGGTECEVHRECGGPACAPTPITSEGTRVEAVGPEVRPMAPLQIIPQQ
ncbi:MAG TPA: hypothetical protein VF815_46875 [Myxococcaceae bacterium]